ncbi:TF-B3 domain-containing protein [Heracleum sosnowskyi]|uniref:TF-B3 domain-containing protein n=1 Tax=Heracleum sosnowskyi TaxID=360622 RepID=A0AAD8M6L6_9APIA|nr:TF-B3 domain-containing protein [Heracleum sosnowskyi]
MESFGLEAPKFVKILSRKDVVGDELKIPSSFCTQFGERIRSKFHLKLRTGFLVPVEFDKRRGVLMGLGSFFNQFDFKGGEMLVFEYFGRLDFNLSVLGTNCSEIEYPLMVNSFQTCKPVRVKLVPGGWRFAKFMDPTEKIYDKIDLPLAFLNRCASALYYHFRMVLSNGKNFLARYDRDSSKITGFHSMCEILGLPDLNSFHMLLFTFDGYLKFDISAFDANMFEIVFPGSPIRYGVTGELAVVSSRFEIKVQPFHMERYCYGVDISTEYMSLCSMWGRNDYIVAYNGSCSWKLQVKRRNLWKRTTIHDGWIDFRNDLDLKAGDVCVFESPAFSINHFTVSVISNSPGQANR